MERWRLLDPGIAALVGIVLIKSGRSGMETPLALILLPQPYSREGRKIQFEIALMRIRQGTNQSGKRVEIAAA